MRTLPKPRLVVVILWLLLMAKVVTCQGASGLLPDFSKIDALLDRGEHQQAWQLLTETPWDEQIPGPVLWRLARAQYEMGRAVEPDPAAAGFFRQSEHYARAAITIDPDMPDGYKWLAIALGAQAKGNDARTQIRLSREVKESIEKALALAPDDDIACLVLSRWHYKVATLDIWSRTFATLVYGGLPEASLSEAEQLLLRAIALRDRIAHRYNLARVYLRQGRRDEAKVQLQKARSLPVTFQEEVMELQKCREQLREWQE